MDTLNDDMIFEIIKYLNCCYSTDLLHFSQTNKRHYKLCGQFFRYFSTSPNFNENKPWVMRAKFISPKKLPDSVSWKDGDNFFMLNSDRFAHYVARGSITIHDRHHVCVLMPQFFQRWNLMTLTNCDNYVHSPVHIIYLLMKLVETFNNGIQIITAEEFYEHINNL